MAENTLKNDELAEESLGSSETSNAPTENRSAASSSPIYTPGTAQTAPAPFVVGTSQATPAPYVPGTQDGYQTSGQSNAVLSEDDFDLSDVEDDSVRAANDTEEALGQVWGSASAESVPVVTKKARGTAKAAPDVTASVSAQLTATLPTLDANVSSTPMGRPIITLSHVTKIYPAQPEHPALNDVSLQIYAGEFVFLVGHSGSGKSTFIRMLTREVKPTSGHIYIADEDLTKMRNWRVPYLRRNVGCVFQDFKLLMDKTVFENVAFALEVIGKSRHVIKTQVPEVLRLVGLQEKMNKMPDQLSGGEQQRVSIARAIVNRPPLLICDEPTGNLDPQTSRGIMDLLERINRTGTTVLVATHDREMVDNMRRRVIALDHG